MGSIDDIKNKLNLDTLDKDSRKKMFDKFVEKGGQVVEEKKSTAIKFNREKQRVYKSLEDKNKKNIDEKYQDYRKSQHNSSAYSKEQNKESQPQRDHKKIKHYLSVFFNGFFQGIFSLSGNFSKKFCREMSENFTSFIKELFEASNDLLNANLERKWKNVDLINTVNPYAYEILIRTNSLYSDTIEINISHFFNRPKKIISSNLTNDIRVIFKKLLILHPYWETAKEVFWKAEQIYQDYTTISPMIPRSKINKMLDRLFTYFFPRLLTILNYNLGEKIDYDYQKMQNFVKLAPEEFIGSITKELEEQRKMYLEYQKKEKEEALKKMQLEIEKKEMEKIPKYIQKGLLIIDKIIEKAPEMANNDNELKKFEKNEKMLEFYSVFKEFDTEYSIIMTTSQIKYNIKLESGSRIDIKSDLENLFIRYNEIIAAFKDYINLLDNRLKFTDTSDKSKTYFQQNIDNIDKKREAGLQETRNKASNVFNKLSVILQTVIKDYNTEKRLLLNPDEKLDFQIKKEGKYKLENVNIINAIVLTFSFASAFHYYLNSGRLSGRNLFISKKKEENVADDAATQQDDKKESAE